MASEIFERVSLEADELTARVATYPCWQCAFSPQLASTASGIWRWLFCQKRKLSPRNLLMLELSNFGKWKEKENLCLQKDRQTANSEWNCQVCQSANRYTMGQTNLGFNQLPDTASNLVITTSRTSRIYLKFTNLTTQVDLSSLPLAALPNSFLSYQTKLWHLSSDLYRHTLKTVDTHFKI